MISPSYNKTSTSSAYDEKFFYDEKLPCYDYYYDSQNDPASTKQTPIRPHYLSLTKIKKSVKSFLFERRDHQEKRPQDGKTNPME